MREFDLKWNPTDNTITIPLRRRKPTVFSVNPDSDLFHEGVPFEYIDRVFAVMALCPQHTFQVLTKRPERMAEYLLAENREAHPSAPDQFSPMATEDHVEYEADLGGYAVGERNIVVRMEVLRDWQWPLSNVQLGTSVENQAAADERIPHLLRCPAALRFLSCEPLLGAVTIDSEFLTGEHAPEDWGGVMAEALGPRIDWIICGGESGPGARPCDVTWIRSLVAQCKSAAVPCFVKQIGARPLISERELWELAGMPEDWDELTRRADVKAPAKLTDKKGGNMDEWPADLRVREFPAQAGAEVGG
jgi:protein gp37